MTQHTLTTAKALFYRALRWVTSPSPPSRQVWLTVEFLLFAVLTSVLVSRVPLRSLPDYKVGETAKMEVITPIELTVVDPVRTERLRKEEAEKVSPVFRFDQNVVENAAAELRSAFAKSREQFLTALEEHFRQRKLDEQEITSARFTRFLQAYRGEPASFPVSRALAQLWAQGNSGEEFLGRLISKIRGLYIRADDSMLSLDVTPEQVRILPVVGEVVTAEQIEQSPLVDWNDVTTLAEAKAKVKNNLALDQVEYGDVLTGLLRENTFYAEALTHDMRARVSGQITATNRYSPRQVIVQREEVVTPQIKAALDKLRTLTASKHSLLRFLGLIMVSLAVFWALWRFANRTRVFSLSPLQIFSLAGWVLVVQLVVIRVGIEIADITGFRFLGDIDSPQAYQAAIPFGAAALLCVLLLESRFAVFMGLLVSLFTLLLTEDAGLTTYAAVSGFAAVYGVGRYQQRGAITKAGAIIGVVNAIMALALMMIKIQPLLVFGPVMFTMFCGLLGGFFAAALTSYALPLGESMFGILTDVKLLEMSNVDLPLLRRLAIEAPGTYQHSFIVAALAESAAKAVGANPLLVRIGSYYHDIGKLNNPQMYVENQRGNYNLHELLTPEESAQAIIKHVTEGIRMAQEAGIPKAVLDLIPQHHGTRRLHYFYTKAKQRAEQAGEELDEKAFRYAGPKPQSIEAAIVMMADSAEASTRSLKDHSRENTDRMLSRVIEAIVTDGQLDECNLRMRDLKIIKASFLQTLTDVHHQRIQYPGFTEEELAALAPINYDAVWSEPTNPTREIPRRNH